MSAVKRSLRQFTFGTGKTAGRNSSGRITSFHRGGGAKRLQRTIDLKRNVSSSMGVVERIEYDPNRSSNIALIRWLQGVKPQLPRHRHSTEAESSAVTPRKVVEAEPSSDIRGVFALNSMLPPRVETTARDIFLSTFKRGGKREDEPLALGLPRIAVAAAKPEFFAARGKGEEGLLQVRNWKRNSDVWKNRNKRKAAISWHSI
ncbi:putative ribosomal protein L2 [Lupinus albus]|uniref:60S ribosomal protein L2, mitochondrial n=1 Tax=Lupinus albus TaxID=3870 RepID=A0A6A4QLY0_LUPAL|nr:putative ribosomal protein L2 [Lupinus albus]